MHERGHGPWGYRWQEEMKHGWRGRPQGGDGWSEMWSEWWRGPAPRAERGNVRYLVLDAIGDQARHGYEIIQYIADKCGGAYKPSPGVIYPTLQMLEELGHARAVPRGERKVYEITEEGRKDLAEHAVDVADLYARFRDDTWDPRGDDIASVMNRVGRVLKTFRHGAKRGRLRPSVLKRAIAILDEALTKLEALLEDDTP
jgi:DNA-binding PadR family transcriptional regulator